MMKAEPMSASGGTKVSGGVGGGGGGGSSALRSPSPHRNAYEAGLAALKQATDHLKNPPARGPPARGRPYGTNVTRIKSLFLKMETSPADQRGSDLPVKLSLPPERQAPLQLSERLHRLDPRASSGPSKLQETRKIFEQRTLQEKQATNRILLKREGAAGLPGARLDVVARFNGSTEDLDRLDTPLDRLDTPLDRLDTPLDRLDTPLDRLDTPLDRLDTPLDRLDTLLDRLDTPLDRLDTPPDRLDTPPDRLDTPPDRLDTPLKPPKPPGLSQVSQDHLSVCQHSRRTRECWQSSCSEIPGLPPEEEPPPANRKICFSTGPITVFTTYSNEDYDHEEGLGISIIGMGAGADMGLEKLGIFVKTVTEGGAAHLDTRFVIGRERPGEQSEVAQLIQQTLEQERWQRELLEQRYTRYPEDQPEPGEYGTDQADGLSPEPPSCVEDQRSLSPGDPAEMDPDRLLQIKHAVTQAELQLLKRKLSHAVDEHLKETQSQYQTLERKYSKAKRLIREYQQRQAEQQQKAVDQLQAQQENNASHREETHLLQGQISDLEAKVDALKSTDSS
ncbi:hypothetical protein NHX12_032338 [Muraenolepis orangiensis]|uniref:Neurabin-1/2 PDZ domain-containing protein n=1 Tax=Muraenolepis orangiensis TaxID=630683 RepID=A0A9Q0E5K1_9TELE|nr:hypothetical protein NHX12_032338 [Muraenolepis orangiensis]